MGEKNKPGLNNVFTPVPRKGDHTYSVPLRDWSRLKGCVEKIPTGTNIWAVLSSILLGACLTFLGIVLAPSAGPNASSKEPYWWLAAITGVAFVLTTIFAIITGRLVQTSKTQVLDRIQEIEEDHMEITDP